MQTIKLKTIYTAILPGVAMTNVNIIIAYTTTPLVYMYRAMGAYFLFNLLHSNEKIIFAHVSV
jgi:hypothetical protein